MADVCSANDRLASQISLHEVELNTKNLFDTVENLLDTAYYCAIRYMEQAQTAEEVVATLLQRRNQGVQEHIHRPSRCVTPFDRAEDGKTAKSLPGKSLKCQLRRSKMAGYFFHSVTFVYSKLDDVHFRQAKDSLSLDEEMAPR